MDRAEIRISLLHITGRKTKHRKTEIEMETTCSETCPTKRRWDFVRRSIQSANVYRLCCSRASRESSALYKVNLQALCHVTQRSANVPIVRRVSASRLKLCGCECLWTVLSSSRSVPTMPSKRSALSWRRKQRFLPTLHIPLSSCAEDQNVKQYQSPRQYISVISVHDSLHSMSLGFSPGWLLVTILSH